MGRDRGARSWPEAAVLAIAVVAASAVVWAAVVPFGDPRGLGRASHLARVAALEVGLAARWERFARDGGALRGVEGAVAWLEPGERAQERRPDAARASAAFEALLAEARRVEGAGGAVATLDVLATAFDTAISGGERAVATVRAVQAAARAGDGARARALWEERRGELAERGPGLAADARLLAAIAVAPLLDAAERRALQGELVGLWEAAELVLPEIDDMAGMRAALVSEVAALADAPDVIARLARAEARERGRRLARTHGALPEAALEVRPVDDGALWLDPSADPLPLAALDVDGTLAARASDALASGLLLPADTRVALRAADAAPTADRLGRAVALPGTPFVAELVHPDSAELAREAAAPFDYARMALLGSAAAILVAGALTARGLARARRLTALRTEFVASVSHELRTPLAALLLLAENLARGVGDGERRAEYHAGLVREASRLRRLVDDVLDFSRLERGKELVVERSATDARALSEEIADDARRVLAGRGVELVCEGADALPPTIDVDAAALRRAVGNLVDNAARHSGGRRVRIHWTCKDGALAVAIEDDGRGLGAAERERVFSPFERGRAARAPGAGLGLAIVRAIARAHGGDAFAGAADGGGARFELRLPHHAP